MLIAPSFFFDSFDILFESFGILTVPRFYDSMSLEAAKIPGFAL
jgi:hypothetical protein